MPIIPIMEYLITLRAVTAVSVRVGIKKSQNAKNHEITRAKGQQRIIKIIGKAHRIKQVVYGMKQEKSCSILFLILFFPVCFGYLLEYITAKC